MLTWVHPSPQPTRVSIGSAGFVQLTAECPYALHWAALPLKVVLPSMACKPHILSPNAISIGTAVFAQLTTLTDRQTDRQTMLLGL